MRSLATAEKVAAIALLRNEISEISQKVLLASGRVQDRDATIDKLKADLIAKSDLSSLAQSEKVAEIALLRNEISEISQKVLLAAREVEDRDATIDKLKADLIAKSDLSALAQSEKVAEIALSGS